MKTPASPQPSPLRLNLLRAMYLLIVIGLGIVVWPNVIRPPAQWDLMQSVVQCMLAAFSLLCALGLRYPLQMLPVLLWELGWKGIWLLVVALPAWLAGTLDQSTAGVAMDCTLVILVILVMPWRYLAAHYIRKGGEQWRAAA